MTSLTSYARLQNSICRCIRFHPVFGNRQWNVARGNDLQSRMSKPRQLRRLKWTWLLAILASGAGVGWYLNRPGSDAPLYQSATVSRGDLAQIITASGQLDPVTKVEVGSQISGSIQKLFVDFNSPVQEGQIIAQLDPATYEASRMQAEGNLANAKAALELAQINANRAKSLRADNLIPQSEFDKALADLHQAEAAVKINEGTLKKAQVDLAHCTIYSPIGGMVISRNVNSGQTVAASLSAPILFVIANDLSKMQIEAKVAEADVGSVAVGQPTEFTVDAYPGRTFRGRVTQIRNAPTIDQNVVTYDAIIEVTNPDLKLKPGMTADVSITVARRDDALRLPNAALRFRPVELSRAKAKDSASTSTQAASKNRNSTGERPGKDKNKHPSERTVYLVSNNSGKETMLKPVKIRTGISDSFYTEVLEGLQEGDRAATGEAVAQAKRTVNPFVAGRRK